MADLADSIFNNEDFQAIMEAQVWVNGKVEDYMDTADSISEVTATNIILSWAGTSHSFSNQDTSLVIDVLGFPDEESFQNFVVEMSNEQESFVGAFFNSLSTLDTAELEELTVLLSARANSSVQGDSLVDGGSLEIEFRRADSCCTRPNQCSWTVCTELNNCVENAWQFYFSTIVSTSSAGAIGGWPGIAIGFSAGVTFGAVYLGSRLDYCERNANEGCELCDCG